MKRVFSGGVVRWVRREETGDSSNNQNDGDRVDDQVYRGIDLGNGSDGGVLEGTGAGRKRRHREWDVVSAMECDSFVDLCMYHWRRAPCCFFLFTYVCCSSVTGCVGY